jgi:hypothetical protein
MARGRILVPEGSGDSHCSPWHILYNQPIFIFFLEDATVYIAKNYSKEILEAGRGSWGSTC